MDSDPSTPLISVKSSFTLEALDPAFRAHLKRFKLPWITFGLGIFFLIVGLVLLFWLLRDAQPLNTLILPVILILSGSFVVISRLCFPTRVMRRAARKASIYGTEIQWDFFATEFVQTLPDLSSRIAYAKPVEWYEIDEGLMIYLEKNQFLWLPQSAFAREADYRSVVERFQSAQRSS